MNSAGTLRCSALEYDASIVQSLRWMISGGRLLRRYLHPPNRARIATHLQGIFISILFSILLIIIVRTALSLYSTFWRVWWGSVSWHLTLVRNPPPHHHSTSLHDAFHNARALSHAASNQPQPALARLAIASAAHMPPLLLQNSFLSHPQLSLLFALDQVEHPRPHPSSKELCSPQHRHCSYSFPPHPTIFSLTNLTQPHSDWTPSPSSRVTNKLRTRLRKASSSHPSSPHRHAASFQLIAATTFPSQSGQNKRLDSSSANPNTSPHLTLDSLINKSKSYSTSIQFKNGYCQDTSQHFQHD